MNRRTTLKAAGAAFGAAALAHPISRAFAVDRFPSRPIKLLVGFTAGGVTDVVVRALAEAAGGVFRQPVLIENRAGAGGTLPAYQMQQTQPDGYTVGLMPQSIFRLPYTAGIKWNPVTDLEYIIRLTGYTWGLVVPASSPIKSFSDYVAYAKAHPEELTYGTTGTMTTQHLTMEQIAKQLGIKLNNISFKGVSEAIPAMLGGHIMSIADASSWVPYVESGQMRLLVVWTERRVPRFPNVPTLREVGVNLVQTSPWGLAAPKGTSETIVQTLHHGFRQAMQSKMFKEALLKYDMEEQYLNGTDYRKFAADMVAKEAAQLKQMGVPKAA